MATRPSILIKNSGAGWGPTTKPGGQFLVDSNHIVKDGSNNITQITDRSTNSWNVDCTTNCFPGTAGKPLWVANQLNGQPCMRMDANSGGRFSGTCSPLSGPAVIGAHQQMGLSWVHKAQTYATGKYSSLCVLSSGVDQTSSTMYFTNAGFGATFYYQFGGSFGVGNESWVIGNANPLSLDVYHYVIFNYNGAGDPTNAANYELTVNGSIVELTAFLATGADAAYNWFGNHGDPPTDVGPGDNFCFYLYNSMILGQDKTGIKRYYHDTYGL